MNALTLAEYLGRHIHIAAMHDQCANKLRRQHEAIVKLREALGECKYGLEGARIWGGMEWTYNPLHAYKYLPLRDSAEQALKDTEDLK